MMKLVQYTNPPTTLLLLKVKIRSKPTNLRLHPQAKHFPSFYSDIIHGQTLHPPSPSLPPPLLRHPRSALTIQAEKKMKHKAAQFSFNKKPLLLGFALLGLLVIVLRSRFSSSPDPQSTPVLKPDTPTSTTPKIAPSLANTIIHYATSNITPQQTFDEISVAARVLEKRSPCNFLVFGLGHDSLMWSALNHGGRTVFLEEDRTWMEKIRERFPDLESYHAVYKTKVKESDELLKLRTEKECTEVGDARNSKCPLSLMDLPAVFYETEWDLIMVDAPTGYFADAPGRMGAIYTAGMVARARRRGETDVFVHDVDRVVEDEFSIAFLCKGYLKEQEGRIRHFSIPSHRSAMDFSFCP